MVWLSCRRCIGCRRKPIGHARTLDELPTAARDYIRAIESAVAIRADFVGVGPEREAAIERANPFDRPSRK